jgi:hypothetical protein
VEHCGSSRQGDRVFLCGLDELELGCPELELHLSAELDLHPVAPAHSLVAVLIHYF